MATAVAAAHRSRGLPDNFILNLPFQTGRAGRPYVAMVVGDCQNVVIVFPARSPAAHHAVASVGLPGHDHAARGATERRGVDVVRIGLRRGVLSTVAVLLVSGAFALAGCKGTKRVAPRSATTSASPSVDAATAAAQTEILRRYKA